MKQSCCFSFLWLLVLLAGDALAGFTGKGHIHTLSSTRQEFLNHECLVSTACGLKRFAVTKTVEEVWFSDDPNHPTYGSGVIMEYETDSVATLERFAVVQFVKGCVFYSSKNGRGKISRTVIDTVTSFGEQVPFCFPDWVIDSQDTDPAYNSDPEQGRFHLLRSAHTKVLRNGKAEKPGRLHDRLSGRRIRRHHGGQKYRAGIQVLHLQGSRCAERDPAAQHRFC
jgi:hypothetical protein